MHVATKVGIKKRCNNYSSPKTPQWRSGPNGIKTLCNACGIIYKEHKAMPDVVYPVENTEPTNSDFDARPMVMLLGQYSTGKTTFIKHILKSTYPGAHIGPEPRTDRFVVVMVV